MAKYQYSCKICSETFDSGGSLSNHIKMHGFNSIKEYFILFFCDGVEPVCSCGTRLKFRNMQKGFYKKCSHSCAAKEFRCALRKDEDRFNSFREKMSLVVKKEWGEKDQTSRINAMTESVRRFVSTLTPEERKEKYGWMNKITPEEKARFIETVTKQTGMCKWWEDATEEEKQDVFLRRSISIMAAPRKDFIEDSNTIVVPAELEQRIFRAIANSLGVDNE